MLTQLFRRFPALAVATAVTTALISGPAAAQAAPAAAPAALSPAASSVGGPILRSEVLSRARAWLNDRSITYSQSAFHPDPQGRGYRQDCSGFASMALHASTSYNTESFVSSGAAKRLGGPNDLEPGDLLGIMGPGTGGDGGHVMIFVGWNDSAHKRFTVYEQNGADNANYPHQSTYTWPLSDSRGTYQPYRYAHIVDDPATAPTSHVLSGDVNGDGRADLVAVDKAGEMFTYLNQGGSGTQTWGGKTYDGYGWQASAKILLADVDGDHKADLIAVHPDGKLYVYLNKGGTGTQTWGAATYAGFGWTFPKLMAADINGDGRADLVAVDNAGKMYTYANRGGSGTTTWAGQNYAGYGWQAYPKIAVSDVDGNGRADLVATDGDAKLHVYLNAGGSGTGTWGANTYAGFGWVFPGIVPADVNGDHKADLITIHDDGKLYVYGNKGGSGTQTWGGASYAGYGWNEFTF